MRDADRDDDVQELPYVEALRRLLEEGFDRVEKSLYAESLDAQLRRLERGPEPAREQRVRLVRSDRAVELYRVHRSGDRVYVDESPQATVRKEADA
jgi:hypothetical protein